MKKFLSILILVVYSLFSLALAEDIDLSVYSDEQLQNLRTKIDVELSNRQAANAAAGGILLEGDFKETHVSLIGLSLSKDYADSPAIVLTFNFQSNSSDGASFILSVFPKLFQNGVELESGMLVDGVDSSETLKKVKDGATIQVKTAYILYDTTSPVEIQLNTLIGKTVDSGIFPVPEE